jgi:AcrR family transcriptional regulator
MKAEGSVKHECIVDAAIKRFSHFGVNKTKLTEIADDIGISKTSLFYYFPDKSSLMEAVGRKIIYEFLHGFEVALTSANSVEEGLLKFIEVKREYFKKYLLLALQASCVEINKVSVHLPDVILEAKEKTSLLISDLLTRGIQEKRLRPFDVRKTANLLLETLEAFEYGIKYKITLVAIADIDILFDKQKEVVQLILNGLKSSESKN